ncbi:MAG: hypothetical protein ACRD5G_08895 [Candidatus Acidiferrales bacterium]
MMAAICYVWQITAGHRLSPWRSPYVRWRLETYFGKKGDVKNGGEFARLLWRERREMWRFLRWVEERRAEQARRSDG